MDVQRLFIYPVKSLLPVEVASVTITPTGLLCDRSFVLVLEPSDPLATAAEHLTIKTTSQLCLFQPSISDDLSTLTITHKLSSLKSNNSLSVPLQPSPASLASARTYRVSIFKSTLTGSDMGQVASDFFTAHLPHLDPKRVLLLYVGDTGARPVPAPSLIPPRAWDLPFPFKYIPVLPRLATYLFTPPPHPANRIKAHDGAPILLTITASENDAMERWPEDFPEKHQPGVTITRFRPNIHIATPNETPAYDEDGWTKVSITPKSRLTSPPHRSAFGHYFATDPVPVMLDLVFHTPRCQSLNIDFSTGLKLPSTTNQQLYKLLLKDRCINPIPMFKDKPCFGRYCLSESIGAVISVGDVVEVIERSE